MLFRVGREFGAAAAGAEEIGDAAMAVAMRCLRRIDHHAADRILGFGAGCRGGRHCVHPYHLVTNGKNASALPAGAALLDAILLAKSLFRQVERFCRPIISTAETASPTTRPLEKSGSARISFSTSDDVAISAPTPPCR